MNFFQLGQNGYGNLYYASGIRSMTDSWHNFFFVSFDPGGFVTIDKPPLGFWLQTISAKIFGFTSFSIFLPQALCGVLAVLFLYYLVQRHFGVVAGLLAALALAVSPISVVTNRNNTIDSTLALALLLSAWAVMRAAESGKLRWLALSAVFVGLGFNIKMAEAYLLLPALILTYLLCAPRPILKRIGHLLVFVVIVLALSISWLGIVDLTPAAQRPYVGSTKNNSEISLATGYNGVGRLRIGGGGPFGRTPASNVNPMQQILDPAANGANGPLRLFSQTLGGQIAWLLPLALLGIVSLAWKRRFRPQEDRQQSGLVLWGMWLLTMTIFFTVFGAFHEYYLTEMAPGLSAMVGIGLVMMWQDYCQGGWRGWLLPIALVLTAWSQISLLASYPEWSRWMSPLIGSLTGLAVIGLILFRLLPGLKMRAMTMRIAGIATGIGLGALLISPTIWAGYSVIQNTESSAPTAGPGFQAARAGVGGGGRPEAARAIRSGFGVDLLGGAAQANPALVSYLNAHQGTTMFLVATPSSGSADALILTTNKPVMALGGFSGSDPILTVSQLQTLIQNNTVRYFLLAPQRGAPGQLDQLPERYREFFERGGNAGGIGGFGRFGGAGQNTLISWVSSNCSQVPATAFSSLTALGNNHLYDCGSRN
jgi:4-amino-4-deoxy-L-arabinose transferase-like glycosyltransferase